MKWDRRSFLATASAAATSMTIRPTEAQPATAPAAVPAAAPRIRHSCKLTMIAKEVDGRRLSLVERLQLAPAAGFDGVDFDEAGKFTVDEVRSAVDDSGVFVHNAINHDHWKHRLTSPQPAERARAVENLKHCLRVAHAAGGSGVLIVVGHGKDGPRDEIEARCQREIEKALPLAAELGQPILFENVWNRMGYDHDQPPEQPVDRFVEFIDRFNSPWVGLYYDLGNHWKYGQPGEWIRGLGRRCVKLDVKGFSRAQNKFTDIGAGDLPWADVRAALTDIGFTGWATAEVGGGGPERLAEVRRQMAAALTPG